MDSDSDRTIDSDELEEIIKESEYEKSKREASQKTMWKRKQVPASKLHEVSDSESDCEDTKKPNTLSSKKVKLKNNPVSKLHEVSDSESDSEDTKKPNTLSSKQVKLKNNPASKLHEVSDSESDNEDTKKPSTLPSKKVKLENNPAPDLRPKCKYGKECYRKNPNHLRNFSHASDEMSTESLSSSMSVKSERPKESALNLHDFGFFVTKVSGISDAYNYGFAKGIKDILCISNGKLVASAQFNYMIDIPWLMEQYPKEFRSCPLTIIHGEQRQGKKSLEMSGSGFDNIKFCQAGLDIPYGTHHTKMMFLLYEEGFKVVIHTSNLVPNDWFQKSQGMWISPMLPKLKSGPSATEGESATKFKHDLLEYVYSYGAHELEEWCTIIKNHEFSKIRVFLIGSSPGRHIGSKKTAFGHLKLRKVLNLYGPTKDTVSHQWPLIGQFSSIGSLGQTPDAWLCGEWCASLATMKGSSMMSIQNSMLKLIFPSVENVRKSLEGYPAGASLPYSYKVAHKQTYLNNFLHQWRSDRIGRSEASPHIKTYLRISPDNEDIAWFLVTSANLSKAAWGALEKKGAQFMIRSYELGVLFLPQNFDFDVFKAPNSGTKDRSQVFPVPYDIPLTPYSKQDEPWTWDAPHIAAPDRNGNKWCPS